MIRRIDAAKAAGDTLGGIVEVVALGVPVGLGSHVSWDTKLDGRLAQALMSIPAVKGVENGFDFRNFVRAEQIRLTESCEHRKKGFGGSHFLAEILEGVR